MKTKFYLLMILLMFAGRPITAQAVEHNFAAGSIIIPMDQFYQPEDVAGGNDQDGGILEAYGLVYYLLAHQDQTEMLNCQSQPEGAVRDLCEAMVTHDITVYWLIDENKTAIGDPDLIIQDDTLVNAEVVKLFDHSGGDPTTLTFDTARSDGASKITYRGGIWAIDINDLTRSTIDPTDPNLDDLAAVESIIRQTRWSEVRVHVAQVPFAAQVYRKMKGKPPRVALLNSEENLDRGNAKILESYLRLAGICPDVYDVISPNQIGGVVDVNGDSTAVKHVTSALFNDDGTLKYEFLWAPHWTGQDKYDDDVNEDGVIDVDEIVLQVRQFLKNGGSMLAECASIETFEYNVNGRFLTDHGFAHNGGTNNENLVAYNDVTAPYAQIGDFGGFQPEGGHLHNWRPFQIGDDDNFNFDTLPTQDSSYNETVTRYTVDDEDQDGVGDLDWDYYVGGYAYGKQYNGYVVYLGGHSFAECKDDGKLDAVATEAVEDIHPLKLEFTKDIKDENFTFVVNYHCPHDPYTLTANFAATNFGTLVVKDDRLQIDFTNAKIKKKKKIEGIEFKNLKFNEELYIDSIILSWTAGAESDTSQKIKKLTDDATDIKHYDDKNATNLLNLTITEEFTMQRSPGSPTGPACSFNEKCEWSNVAGVRYVLNTLFNIRYMKGETFFARAAPVVSHPYLYQGYFGWEPRPETWVDDYMVGHFRRYDVTQTPPLGGIPVYDWDTAVDPVNPPLPATQLPRPMPLAGDDNADSDGRQVFTAEDDGSGSFSKINFDFDNIEDLRVPLDLTPDTGAGEDEDEEHLINRVRGKRWNHTVDPGVYVDDPNRLGGIMHSAPVIVRGGGKDSRFTGREEVAYVGDLNGMLHAIKTATGEEKWAYIPSNLLGKLKNVRGDPNAVQDFAAVDASPTVKHIYYDLDYNPEATPAQTEDPSWHSILVCPQGFGGRSIFVLDVTDPDDWKVLWETDSGCPPTSCTTEPTSGAAEICQDGVVKYCPSNYNAIQDTCNKSWKVRTNCSDGDEISADVGTMGHAFRASLDKVKVKVPVLDNQGDPIPGQYDYKLEWRVFVATSFDVGVEEKGGINVFAFDLRTGARKWAFSSEYANSVNDIPGAITTFDTDDDTFADRIYVGDMNGRMWALNAADPDPDVSGDPDRSVFKTSGGTPVPMFSAGVDYPISVSPAIIRHNGHVLLVFGTGGADWAGNDLANRIYVVDTTKAEQLVQSEIDDNYADHDAAEIRSYYHELPVGQKVWSSPTIAAGQIWVATASGTMESADPNNDLLGQGQLQVLGMEAGSLLKDGLPISMKKVRGSLYVSNEHVYATGIDGSIIQFGGALFTAGIGNRVLLKTWQDR